VCSPTAVSGSASCLALGSAQSCAMTARVRIIKHEAVPLCGSFEVSFPDGRPSEYFYFEDIPARRLRPHLVDRATARRAAPFLARAEQTVLDSQTD
jgi:hypothetical protein